jgi:hypothetical protein
MRRRLFCRFGRWFLEREAYACVGLGWPVPALNTKDWLREPPSRKWRRCGFSLTTSTLLTETVKCDVSKLNCTVPFIGLLSKHTILSMAI